MVKDQTRFVDSLSITSDEIVLNIWSGSRFTHIHTYMQTFYFLSRLNHVWSLIDTKYSLESILLTSGCKVHICIFLNSILIELQEKLDLCVKHENFKIVQIKATETIVSYKYVVILYTLYVYYFLRYKCTLRLEKIERWQWRYDCW